MDLDERALTLFMDAGASAIRFNSPIDTARAVQIAEFVSLHAKSVVDLGCGRGTLAVEIARRQPELPVVGIDSDPRSIEEGRSAVAERSLADRVTLQVGDVTESIAAADAALCIGSSHAFDGPAPTMERLRGLGRSAAVVGDLVWSATAGQEHTDLFGDLPEGEQGLADLAIEAGWTVVESFESSLAEWDGFEGGWTEGVRRIGTEEANAFADERKTEYESYRGVAGFVWLFLTQ